MFKRKAEPVGPFGFTHSVEIARAAEEVYVLLDWADPRNAKRALGNKVEQVGTAPDRFRLWLDVLPDHVFELTVLESVSGQTYAFEDQIKPSIGRLVSMVETYNIDPLDEQSCVLTLVVAATFAGRISKKELAREVVMMSAACENALAKLKIQAEQGVDAVHRIEAMQMDGFEDQAVSLAAVSATRLPR